MLALSVTQPWASLIMAGLKLYETRGWRRGYRGRLAIHATKEETYISTFALENLAGASGFDSILTLEYPLGAILGTVELVRCWRTEDVRGRLSRAERAFGDYGDWRFAWEFAPEGRILLEKPIQCAGRLGLWSVPAAIAVALEQRL